MIEFAISADVTQEFRKAVHELEAAAWQPLYRTVEGETYETDQEWAEVCFVLPYGIPPGKATFLKWLIADWARRMI